MPVLDLSDNTLLVAEGAVVEIQDPRDVHRCNDCRLLFRAIREGENLPRFEAVLCRMHAGRRLPDGRRIDIVDAKLAFPHAAYGRKVLQGTATYEDGIQEEWRIRVDPLSMRFEWIRQPEDPSTCLYYRLLVPSQHNTLELWHTGKGQEIAAGGIERTHAHRDALDAVDETELLFYSVFPKNCFRIERPQGGDAHIRRTELVRSPLPGEPESYRDDRGMVREPVWEVIWEGGEGAMAFLNGTWGVVAAVNDLAGRRACPPSDATLDFGPFYAQMYLGCLPLNIQDIKPGLLTARSSVLAREEEPAEASTRETAWASEFLYLANPEVARSLLRTQLERASRSGVPTDPRWPVSAMTDDAVAELLIMAGRYFAIERDREFARANLELWRRCATYLLGLRPQDDALPITTRTWDAQGVLIGKEPYFTALCYAGLLRLGYIEEALDNMALAARWRREAEAIQEAALTPYQYGGLWHPERGVFINHHDYRDPAETGPRRENWQPGRRLQTATPWADFALYENVVPFWLGLVEDWQLIETAYDWIDGNFTYASGRGGPKFPPYMCDTFTALLDVCVRLKHGIQNTEFLLQSVIEHALDSGVPLSQAPFGGHVSVSPNDFAELTTAARRLPAGRLLDNSPYFGLVLHLHYGLDYAKQGWYIGVPRPLGNYPLTRVTNLRHERATYSVTWHGRGKVRRVTIDGKIHRSLWLDLNEGRHEVVVELG